MDTCTSIRVWGRSALGLLLLASAPCWADAPASKRVLVVHSFGNAAPPFTTHSIAFETELTDKIGERVDLDEVSLDVARYATLDMEEALVELMRKRQSKWQPDLVVPFGSPAGIFVARHRDRLFPETTPIIYTGMDQRLLPAGALDQNATFVGESFDLPAMVDDMLQIAPATTNIAVVIGSSPLEGYWTEAFRREWAPYTNRVGFTWLNDLTYDQLLDRVSKLPPRSFIFLVLLMRDASGVTHNADEALRRIREVANAPVNGIFQHQLGLGIVGGRLYQAELEGVESAHIAIQVLRGASVTNFPPRLIDPLDPRYDWRELRRWNISEDRLPPGSTVLFREPTLWEQYRWKIIGVLSVVLLQALLITFLFLNLVKRWRSEKLLRESEQLFRTVADSAPVLIWMSDVDGLCTFTNKPWLDFTGRTATEEMGNGWTEGVHPDDLPGCLKSYQEAFDAREPFTLLYRRRRHDGEYRWISDHGVPRYGAEGHFAGYIGSCTDITERRKSEAETQLLREELTHVSRVATMGELTASIAHELNQPLAAILSNAQEGARLATTANPDLNELRDILQDIAADDRRASEVIRKLRMLLKKDPGEQRPLPLNDLITEMVSVVHHNAVLRNIAVDLDLAEGLPRVKGDRIQLQQVLLNLVVNGFEAMSEVGDRPRKLILRTRLLDEKQVLVNVIDNGTGIIAEKLDSIFEPFYSTKKSGMGMGLSVSRSILEAHGGKLWAENNPQGGATFHLTLPVNSDH